MRRHIKRLLLAALISLSCAFGTFAWYRSGLRAEHRNHESEPIAQLAEANEEVLRKPAKRAIWEAVGVDEPLYSGEAVRTSKTSDAKIRFLKKNGVFIELQPESVVVLEDGEKGLQLNFLEGSIFVRADSGADGITLKSGENEIALNEAEMSLNKGADDSVDMQVFKGSADLSGSGKKVTLGKNQSGTIAKGAVSPVSESIQIESPAPNDLLYMDPSEPRFNVKWRALSADYSVAFEEGASRSDLKPVPSGQLNIQTGSMSAPAKIGKIYWRLVATSSDPQKPKLSSAVFRNQILPQTPPVLLEPGQGESIEIDKEHPEVVFRWSNPAKLKALKLEVWKANDKGSAEKVDVDALKSWSRIIGQGESGKYAARISGSFVVNGKTSVLSSPVREFVVKFPTDARPPVLKTPLNAHRFDHAETLERGVLLVWEPLRGISKFQVTVQSEADKKPITQTVPETNYRIKNLNPGEYVWWVSALGESGKETGQSEKRRFVIDEIRKLNWADGRVEDTVWFSGNEPELKAEWTPLGSQSASWRVRVFAEKSSERESAWQKAESPQWKQTVPKEGSYSIQVEELNDEGRVIGRAPKRTVLVRRRPLLDPPAFAANLPETLQALPNGSMRVQWQPVAGARETVLEVRNSSGEVIRELAFPGAEGVIESLKPGGYRLSLRTRDEFGRVGPAGKERGLKVPDKSNVRAPTFKKIEVK